MLHEFQALVNRKKNLESVYEGNSELEQRLSFRDSRIEDLCLDFTLPGYPDIILASGSDHTMVKYCLIFCIAIFFVLTLLLLEYKTSIFLSFWQVNMRNLDDYVSLIVDATVKSGISRQVEAFKSGFNQVSYFVLIIVEIF